MFGSPATKSAVDLAFHSLNHRSRHLIRIAVRVGMAFLSLSASGHSRQRRNDNWCCEWFQERIRYLDGAFNIYDLRVHAAELECMAKRHSVARQSTG